MSKRNKAKNRLKTILFQNDIIDRSAKYNNDNRGESMYNDEELIAGDNAQMLAKAYNSFVFGRSAGAKVTEGQAKTIIEEMCEKCLSGQKKTALSAIAALMSKYPEGEQCAVNGYYDAMNKLYDFVCSKLGECIEKRKDIEMPLTIAVLLLLSEKHMC